MTEKMLEIAARTLKIPKEEVTNHYQDIPEIGATYFWDEKRGGLSVIVGEDGSRLAATSAVSYEKHLDAYKAGKRN